MKRVERSGLYLVVLALGLTFAFPFIWTIMSSFKGVGELYRYPPTIFPATIRWQNYVEIFATVPFASWLLNSATVTVLSLLGELVSACLVAYGFARFDFPYKNILFVFLLSTLMLPVQVTLIPSYLLFNVLGWIDTFKPLIVPSWIGGSAFSIFLLRQFLMSLPTDFDEAATIDGADPLMVLIRILVPLAKPAIATIAVISFIGSWDAFLGPLIYLNSPSKMTVAVGLRYFESVSSAVVQPMEHLLMGAALIVAAPPVILFFLAQQYFVQGIVMSGIKG